MLRVSLASSSRSAETPHHPPPLHHHSLEKLKSSRQQPDAFLMEYFLL